ncbi:hypothetical protein IFO70_23015 [Phormidium tenue FACHB-886]|nr:hypothetical protein [Phormidium tenue FACHB-886]
MSNEPEDESLGVEQLPQDELEARPDQSSDPKADEVANPAAHTESAESSEDVSSAPTG